MEKLQNIRIISFLLAIGMMVTSCVHDDDFSVPEINMEEPNVNVNTDIATVKAMYGGFDPVLIESGGGSTNEMYLEAYVISSDEAGNIYKQLYIQDTPQNPSAGVVIATDATDMYAKYGPGQKIYFRVDGLYIGKYMGLPTIGVLDGGDVGRMHAQDFEERIYRSLDKSNLVPTLISITEVADESKLATLIKLEDVQFHEDFLGDYYGNPDNTLSVNRTVEDCDGRTVILRNSGYANFKNNRLPEGNGTLTALLSVFNADPQLYIRDTDDVHMNGERCDPGGGGDPIPGDALELPFFEDFEEQTAGVGEAVTIPGWTNVNVNGGERLWEVREFSRNKYAQTSAFNSDEEPYEVWLVTPGLILPSGSSPILTFETKDGFYNGDALSVKISIDFDEDVMAATWTDLEAVISSGNSGGYGDDFISSGNIDLSAYAGEVVYIAFRYLGSTNGVTTTYQIDTISVVD